MPNNAQVKRLINFLNVNKSGFFPWAIFYTFCEYSCPEQLELHIFILLFYFLQKQKIKMALIENGIFCEAQFHIFLYILQFE